MSGEARFEFTAQDNVDAVHTHTGRIFGKVSWALLVVAFLFPIVDIWAGAPILEDTAFFIVLGLAMFFLAWDYLARDWTVRRAFRQSEAMRTPLVMRRDEKSITIDTDASHASFDWGQFWRWMGSSKSLLLYRDSQMFIPIPRRALPDGAYEEIVAALRAAGVREKGRLYSAQSKPIS
jgi:hypothetical protein